MFWKYLGAVLAMLFLFSGTAWAASNVTAFEVVGQIQRGTLGMMKVFLLLGALIATVFVTIEVMKGERESVSKLSMLILGLALGFVFLEAMGRVGGSSGDEFSAFSSALEQDQAALKNGNANNWGKEYSSAVNNLTPNSFTRLIGKVLESIMSSICIIFCGILSVKIMNGDRDSLRKFLITIVVCCVSCGVMEMLM